MLDEWQKERQPSYRQARALHISSNVSSNYYTTYIDKIHHEAISADNMHDYCD